MAGRQLGALARRLQDAGWPADTPALVVSRAGFADEIASDHRVATLAEAALLHSGRPAVVTVGVGARALTGVMRHGTKMTDITPLTAPQ
jgi:uroporphyrin-III C-methyltransferase